MLSPLPPVENRDLTQAERTQVFDRAGELLELTYRSAGHGTRPDLIDDLAHLTLCRNAAEANAATYRTIYRRWGSWDSVRQVGTTQIAPLLRANSIPVQRAGHLIELLTQIHADCAEHGHTGTSLAWLNSLDQRDAAAYLATLPRVSRTEASRVVAASWASPGLDDDPHVLRVLARMELLPPDDRLSGTQLADELPRTVDAEAFRLNLGHHARSVCFPSMPDCAGCPLISFCPTGRRAACEDDKPVAVELFAGGGGLGEGFERAGFDVALAVELDRDAAQTYRLNHPGTVVVEADATAVTGTELAVLAPRISDATALIAGPPCQGYSVAGHRKANDKRNNLYSAVVRIAADLEPRFVVIENVPGMRRIEGESYIHVVLDALAEGGYNANEHLLRACDFGVPQLRRRMIFLAQLTEAGPAPAPPSPTHCAGARCDTCPKGKPGTCGLLATPTVLTTLEGLPRLTHGEAAEYLAFSDGDEPLTNASTMAHSQRVLDKIAGITAGAGPISYRRLHSDLARTIVAGHRALPVHPTLDRTISVREAARIQGFEDTHVFAGTRSKQPLQVANAVPPALGAALAQALITAMMSRGDTNESADSSLESRHGVADRELASSAT